MISCRHIFYNVGLSVLRIKLLFIEIIYLKNLKLCMDAILELLKSTDYL